LTTGTDEAHAQQFLQADAASRRGLRQALGSVRGAPVTWENERGRA
jgi:hypothetical protein